MEFKVRHLKFDCRRLAGLKKIHCMFESVNTQTHTRTDAGLTPILYVQQSKNVIRFNVDLFQELDIDQPTERKRPSDVQNTSGAVQRLLYILRKIPGKFSQNIQETMENYGFRLKSLKLL